MYRWQHPVHVLRAVVGVVGRPPLDIVRVVTSRTRTRAVVRAAGRPPLDIVRVVTSRTRTRAVVRAAGRPPLDIVRVVTSRTRTRAVVRAAGRPPALFVPATLYISRKDTGIQHKKPFAKKITGKRSRPANSRRLFSSYPRPEPCQHLPEIVRQGGLKLHLLARAGVDETQVPCVQALALQTLVRAPCAV